MMNIVKKLLLLLLVAGTCNQNIVADDSESLAMSIAKGSAGALVGGGLGYLLAQFCNGEIIAVHENKMKFLEDLTLFIQSSEYSKGDSSRLFTHYYNGLNQLAQCTRGVEIELLHDFANCGSAEAQQAVLQRIQEVQTQLQASHENSLWIGNIIMSAVGAIIGGACTLPADSHDDSCGCSHGHHHHSTTYVGNFARAAAPANIFSRK